MATLTELLEQAYPKKVMPEPGTNLFPEQTVPRPSQGIVEAATAYRPPENPEAATAGLVGETVGKLPPTPMYRESPAIPMPTTAPKQADTDTSAGRIWTKTGEEGTKNDGGGIPRPTTETLKTTTETDYGQEGKDMIKAAEGIGDAVKKERNFQLSLFGLDEKGQQKLDEKGKPVDPYGVVAAYDKYLARQANLEDILDPTSKGFDDYKKNVEKVTGEMKAAREDLENFQKNAKVDPQRYWKETPMLDHVFNGLQMLMEGQVAAAGTRAGIAMPTGLVQQRIDKAINDDIARQKEEFKMGEAARTNTVNRYRDNMKLLNDERAADIKTRLDLVTMAKGRFESMLEDPRIKAQAAALGVDTNLAKMDFEAKKLAADTMKKVIQNQEVPIKPDKGMTPEEKRKQDELKVSVLGIPMEARSIEDAKTLKEKATASEQAVATLEALEKLRSDAGVADLAKLPTDKMAKAKTLVSTLHMALKQSFALGAMDKGSMDFLESAVPQPSQWTDALDKYRAMRKSLTLGYTNELNQRIKDADFSPSAVANQMDKYNKQRGFTEFLLKD